MQYHLLMRMRICDHVHQPGEDGVSFEIHLKQLQGEFSKTRRNSQIVTEENVLNAEGRNSQRHTVFQSCLNDFLSCSKLIMSVHILQH